MSKTAQTISYLTILLALGLVVLGGYWLLYPYKPITFNDLPFKVSAKTVKAGEDINYTVDYCKTNTLIPVVSRYFVNDIIYSVVTDLALAKPKGCSVVSIKVKIPESIPPDRYKLIMNYQYKVNPLRTIDVPAETELFEVIK